MHERNDLMRNVKPGHSSPLICLDAGHYGKYNRSPAVRDYYESEMNWKLHNYLAAQLEGYGIRVKKTRADPEKDLSLYDRGAASKDCDLFLSIHSNAVGDRVDETVDYVRLYHLTDDKTTDLDDQSKEVAALLLPVIVKLMNPKQGGHITTRKSAKDSNGDGVLNDNYYGVLHGARQAGTAGLILEHSFHTNTAMTRWLMEDKNLRKLAQAEAQALAEYFGMVQPKPEETCSVTLPLIRSGAEGPTVKVMQTLLAFQGFPCANGGADGIYGTGTGSALKAFQTKNSLAPDAVCGARTWAALLNA